LRDNQTLTSSERQERLQQNQQRLEKIESIFNSKDTQQPNNPNSNKFPTGLVVGGAVLLAVIGLVGVLVYKKSKQNKRIKNTRK
jgi:hypothetical protein